MNKIILLSSILSLTLLLTFSIDTAFAHPHSGQVLINGHTHQPQTEITPLTGMMGLEKSTIFFHSSEEKTILVQYGIKKYENEAIVNEKLKTILSEKDIQRNIDTLIGTQRVRRIGPEILQNNESHTELPDLPENLKSVIDNL